MLCPLEAARIGYEHLEANDYEPFCQSPSAIPSVVLIPWKSKRQFLQGRCRENLAHIRQSWPDSGLDFHVKVRKTRQAVPSTLV